MVLPETSPEFAHRPAAVVLPPVSETLQDADRSLELWADGSLQDALLREQIERHAECAQNVTSFLDSLSGAARPIEEIVASEQTCVSGATRFYTSLNTLMQDPENARLALYFPFELIPRAGWEPDDVELRAASESFRETYLDAWYSLLHTRDARANFVDGDVLEVERREGDLPRVVKAAHLIPGLVERDVVSESDVLSLFSWTDDPLLKQGISDGLAALREKQVLTQDSLSEANTSIDVVIIEHRLAMDALLRHVPTDVTERRREWLVQSVRNETILGAAGHIADAVRTGTLPDGIVSFVAAGTSRDAHHMLIEGVREAVTSVAFTDTAQSRTLFDRYYPALTGLLEREDVETAERLAMLFRQCYRAGAVDRAVLDRWGIDLPNLGGPHSENLAGMAEDIERLGEITTHIAESPELSRFVYPVAVLGGSRLKGYGQQSSDVDVSVFLRPGISEDDRAHVRDLLEQAIVNGSKSYEPIEFWLDQLSDGSLAIHDFAGPDVHTADSYWTHVLFSGAWVGETDAIDELQRSLLPRYFRADTPAAQEDRRFYLERLEQDVLQYRLMHKGYVRHYPEQPRSTATQSEAIDGASTFWDPGYRRIATRLFVNNVFLPKL